MTTVRVSTASTAKGHEFEIETSVRTWRFRAESKQDLDLWLQQLSQAMSNSAPAQPPTTTVYAEGQLRLTADLVAVRGRSWLVVDDGAAFSDLQKYTCSFDVTQSILSFTAASQDTSFCRFTAEPIPVERIRSARPVRDLSESYGRPLDQTFYFETIHGAKYVLLSPTQKERERWLGCLFTQHAIPGLAPAPDWATRKCFCSGYNTVALRLVSTVGLPLEQYAEFRRTLHPEALIDRIAAVDVRSPSTNSYLDSSGCSATLDLDIIRASPGAPECPNCCGAAVATSAALDEEGGKGTTR